MCVVSLPALRLHPASIDEVTQTVTMVLQPGLGNGRGLWGWSVGKAGQQRAHRGRRLSWRGEQEERGRERKIQGQRRVDR